MTALVTKPLHSTSMRDPGYEAMTPYDDITSGLEELKLWRHFRFGRVWSQGNGGLKNWKCTNSTLLFVGQGPHCACATETRYSFPEISRRGSGANFKLTARLCVLRWWGTLGTRLWRHPMTPLPVWMESNYDITSGLWCHFRFGRGQSRGNGRGANW